MAASLLSLKALREAMDAGIKHGFVTVPCTVSRISNNLVHEGCPTPGCMKKVTREDRNGDTQPWCSKCKKVVHLPLLYLKLRVFISDGSTANWAMAWDSVASGFLGGMQPEDVSTLCRKGEEKPLFDSLKRKTWMLTVEIAKSEGNHKPYLRIAEIVSHSESSRNPDSIPVDHGEVMSASSGASSGSAAAFTPLFRRNLDMFKGGMGNTFENPVYSQSRSRAQTTSSSVDSGNSYQAEVETALKHEDKDGDTVKCEGGNKRRWDSGSVIGGVMLGFFLEDDVWKIYQTASVSCELALR
ncbi:hypothetical protein R1sor_006409 [Riccia sorocarpa]|uniref:Replication factor A C-terminal domain-containing protein n=1 Tax=Riccia sorocarpa TaxID=122646 RepID=A0ABD3HMY5_9MARC